MLCHLFNRQKCFVLCSCCTSFSIAQLHFSPFLISTCLLFICVSMTCVCGLGCIVIWPHTPVICPVFVMDTLSFILVGSCVRLHLCVGTSSFDFSCSWAAICDVFISVVILMSWLFFTVSHPWKYLVLCLCWLLCELCLGGMSLLSRHHHSNHCRLLPLCLRYIPLALVSGPCSMSWYFVLSMLSWVSSVVELGCCHCHFLDVGVCFLVWWWMLCLHFFLLCLQACVFTRWPH